MSAFYDVIEAISVGVIPLNSHGLLKPSSRFQYFCGIFGVFKNVSPVRVGRPRLQLVVHENSLLSCFAGIPNNSKQSENANTNFRYGCMPPLLGLAFFLLLKGSTVSNLFVVLGDNGFSS